MKTFAIAVGLLAAGAAASPSPSAAAAAAPAKRATLPVVSIKGNAFFAGGKRFYIRGVDYQPGGSSANEDPIANVKTCKRDVAKFKELGLNTIRVYTVDNTADHDECMQALADAGIYLALDVNNPAYSINREKPAKSYNKMYLQSVFATIDAFQKYSNTLMFFSGNEVINDDKTTVCAPYVKATDRDMRSYINARSYRKIPVGYSAADVAENRNEMAAYMNCGPDGARSDFFAFNDYSWCDPNKFDDTDWGMKVKNFSSYSIPLFLSEYGCKDNTRTFNAVSALYDTSKLTSVYSGGLVYEYSEEEGNAGFGLVNIKTDTEVTDKKDFTALKAALKKTPAPDGDGGFKQNGKPSKCPAKAKNWDVDFKDDELPAMPSGVKEYFDNGAGTAPGLKGGSQEAGTDEPSSAPAADGAVTSGASDTGSGAASGSSSSKGAAAGLYVPEFSFAPLVCGLVVLVSSMLGGSLIL